MSLIKELKSGNLNVKVFDSRAAMGKAAANEAALRIKEILTRKSEVNIVFASAPSQNEFLAEMLNRDDIEWEKVNAFHLDEYVGIDPEAPQNFGKFLKDRLFGLVKFKSINYFNSIAADPEAECSRYGELLKKYPPDIEFLGIGENAHIAFNNPDSAFFDDQKRVKVVVLDEGCIKQQINDGCFDRVEDVPGHAYTITVPMVLEGKFLMAIAPGKTKTDAIRNVVKGEIRESYPASILRIHPDAILYTDEIGAGKIM